MAFYLDFYDECEFINLSYSNLDDIFDKGNNPNMITDDIYLVKILQIILLSR
jgi:hypothetical protein